MNIYVAGKTQDIDKVRRVQQMVTSTGHTITHDWTQAVEAKIPPEDQQKYAEADMGGVYKASVVIAVGHPNLCGTMWEVGMAAAWGSMIWLTDWHLCSRRSVFEHLPHVSIVEFTQLPAKLWKTSEERLMRQTSSYFRFRSDGSIGR